MDNQHILDLDRNRIKVVLREAYTICCEVLETSFDLSVDEFVSKINPYLDINRITIPVTINLPSRKHPELIIEVDLRKKSVMSRMVNREKRFLLNRSLKNL